MSREGGPGTGSGTGSLLRRLRDSETRRLELERKLMEYKKSDAYLMKLKYTKLKKYLEELNERQKRALLRNQAILKELNQFEAHMKTSSSELIQKMEEWYGREIKSVLSLREGNLSAQGDEKEYNKQETAVQSSRNSRASVESRTADLNSDTSVEGEEVTCEHLVASAEDYKQAVPVAFVPEPSISEEDQESIPGPQDGPNNGQPSQAVSGDSSSEPLVCAGEGMLMPAGSRTWARGIHPAEVSSPQPSSPCTAEEEPLGSLAPDGFCSQASSLKEDDLEAGEAAVCHQPKALLQSLWGGHPLPGNILCAARGAGEQSRLDLPQDVDVLQAPLSSPTSFMAGHCPLLTEEVVAMFENLLVSGKEAPDDQAPPLLREVLPEEVCGDRSSIQSNESSYSLPSIPNDGREMKQAKHAPRLDGTGKQEVTSWCEDESQEESVIKKIPITGCDIGNDSSKTKESQEICSERSSSSERSGDLSRTEVRKGFVTAIKSKAFWGVSDDSSSESEAALHPQIHSTEADEFDDFYD
ncbi:centrosomal protein kizuna isoform X6 [Anser cygnoides]|uniref:centrosomal protein kizuna isoform X6 n=1 Tax=Anser cygnoides TaxID=8845 RepID=UPI0034D35239